jgi:hypothetical protein
MWLYLYQSLHDAGSEVPALALIDRAAAAGYTGVVLADSSLDVLGTGMIPGYEDRLAQVVAHAQQVGLHLTPQVFGFGHSRALLSIDPSFAEPQPVEGAPMAVSADGRSLQLASSLAPLPDGGFEAPQGDRFPGWDSQGQPGVRTFADATVAHSGAGSLRVAAGSGDGRVVKHLTVGPRRQLHVSFWVRTAGFSGTFDVLARDTASGRQRSFQGPFALPTDQDWTRIDFAFDTMSSTQLDLVAGVRGTSQGTLWLDDVAIEETALVNLVRRDGAPLLLRTADGPLIEGQDFDPISDPNVAPQGVFKPWRTPLTVTLPATTRLRPRQAVMADYYAVQPVTSSRQVGACLSDPRLHDHLTTLSAALDASFPQGTAFFLNYDELRHLDTCALCQSRGLTGAQLLDAHVQESVQMLRSARPGAPLWIWSDLFDPQHNAVPSYWLSEGDLTGSANGLARDVTVVNWNLLKLDTSLRFFSGLGFSQLIAGYYDAPSAGDAARAEVASAKGVPGVRGLVFTTWHGNYQGLEEYAAAARAAW